MKRSRPHNIYLSQQALDIMIALKTCAGNSRYLLPSRYDADAPMSRATFNRITTAVVLRASKEGLPLEPFTVHDLRRTGLPGQHCVTRKPGPLAAYNYRLTGRVLRWRTSGGGARLTVA